MRITIRGTMPRCLFYPCSQCEVMIYEALEMGVDEAPDFFKDEKDMRFTPAAFLMQHIVEVMHSGCGENND